MKQNYDFSRWILHQCLMHGVNLQYASSASVYGLESDFIETTPPCPVSPYAWSKYLFDRYFLEHEWGQITVQGFRYFNVYGPHEDHKGDQASPYYKFNQQTKEKGVITLFEGSEKFFRDFVPVETVVNVHRTFLDVKESGIFNVGTGESKSFQQVAEEIAVRYNARIEYIPMPDSIKTYYQKYTKADISKLRKYYKS
jgi:ADP-L-glycero-D-manno-heptose 6-epimerase